MLTDEIAARLDDAKVYTGADWSRSYVQDVEHLLSENARLLRALEAVKDEATNHNADACLLLAALALAPPPAGNDG